MVFQVAFLGGWGSQCRWRDEQGALGSWYVSLASAGFKGLTVYPGKDLCSSVKRSQCGSDPNQKTETRGVQGDQGDPFLTDSLT